MGLLIGMNLLGIKKPLYLKIATQLFLVEFLDVKRTLKKIHMFMVKFYFDGDVEICNFDIISKIGW